MEKSGMSNLALTGQCKCGIPSGKQKKPMIDSFFKTIICQKKKPGFSRPGLGICKIYLLLISGDRL
jgi:hypothetical protein